MTLVHRARAWLGRRAALLLLVATASGLAAGGLARLAGAGAVADAAWLATAAVGLGYALWSAAESILHGRLGVDVIALLALGGAVAVGELLAAAVISVMLTSGRFLEAWAAERARHDLNTLLARAPRTARRYRGGSLETVPLEEVAIGDVLLVAPGDVLPVDGMVASGVAVLDESALTGEALPAEHEPGEGVRSGTLNAGGPFDLRAETSAADSTYAGIVRLVSEAERSQAPFVRLADRYAMWFLPLTLAVAGIAWAVGGAERAVAVLVVATPCPLILAAPVALVSGLSAAARRGVVVKSGGVLERLARCTTLILDKTGTLTVGQPAVTDVVPAGPLPPQEILTLAASLDQVSGHVLAAAIVRAATGRDGPLVLPEAVEELPGQGIAGLVQGRPVRVGRAAWAGVAGDPGWVRTVRRRARLDGALTVFVAADGQPGAIVLQDRIRPDARADHPGHPPRRRHPDRPGHRRPGRGRRTGRRAHRGRRGARRADPGGQARRGAPRTAPGPGHHDRRRDQRCPRPGPGRRRDRHGSAGLHRLLRSGRRGADRRSPRPPRRGRRAGPPHPADRAAERAGRDGHVPGGDGRGRGRPAARGVGCAAAGGHRRSRDPQRAPRAAPPAPDVRVTPAYIALTSRFRTEHQAIRADIDQLRATADTLDDPGAMTRVRQAYDMLTGEVWPHEAAEEAELYPSLNRLLGGADPTAPMSRAHAEIAYQIARLGRLIDDIGDRTPGQDDLADLRGVLYGLHAILRLHTVQEDETYLSLGDSAEALTA